jgi:O-methyltransferase
MPPSIARLLQETAYAVVRATGELPPRVPDIRHAPVLPATATYSPWLSDRNFTVAMDQVWGFRVADHLRCYELWSLVRQSVKLPAGALLEAGTSTAELGCLIAEAAAYFAIQERVYLCDAFERQGGKAQVDALVARLRLHNVQVVQVSFPAQTAGITDSSFRFVHVNLEASQSSKDAADYLWTRLVPGGIMVFNHYGTYGCEAVTQLVNELAGSSDRIFVHNLNGHGVLIKRDGSPAPGRESSG